MELNPTFMLNASKNGLLTYKGGALIDIRWTVMIDLF